MESVVGAQPNPRRNLNRACEVRPISFWGGEREARRQTILPRVIYSCIESRGLREKSPQTVVEWETRDFAERTLRDAAVTVDGVGLGHLNVYTTSVFLFFGQNKNE